MSHDEHDPWAFRHSPESQVSFCSFFLIIPVVIFIAATFSICNIFFSYLSLICMRDLISNGCSYGNEFEMKLVFGTCSSFMEEVLRGENIHKVLSRCGWLLLQKIYTKQYFVKCKNICSWQNFGLNFFFFNCMDLMTMDCFLMKWDMCSPLKISLLCVFCLMVCMKGDTTTIYISSLVYGIYQPWLAWEFSLINL